MTELPEGAIGQVLYLGSGRGIGKHADEEWRLMGSKAKANGRRPQKKKVKVRGRSGNKKKPR